MNGDYTASGAGATGQGQAAPVSGARRSGPGLGTILLALGGLAIVGGIIVALVTFVFTAPAGDEARMPASTTSTPSTVPSEQSAPAATQAAATVKVSNAEVFTFRDIFEPLLEPVKQPSGSGSGGSGTPGGSGTTTDTADANDYSAGTLYLIDIVTDDGVQKAVLVWDQDEMTLGEGESISGTPWKVLDVRDSSVIMLYGDQQVVLTVGQGIQK